MCLLNETATSPKGQTSVHYDDDKRDTDFIVRSQRCSVERLLKIILKTLNETILRILLLLNISGVIHVKSILGGALDKRSWGHDNLKK